MTMTMMTMMMTHQWKLVMRPAPTYSNEHDEMIGGVGEGAAATRVYVYIPFSVVDSCGKRGGDETEYIVNT